VQNNLVGASDSGIDYSFRRIAFSELAIWFFDFWVSRIATKYGIGGALC
jgi:hypothetical protein